MAWKLDLLYSDGHTEEIDEEYESEEEAREGLDICMEGWYAGREVLMEAGESYSDCDIEDYCIYEVK